MAQAQDPLRYDLPMNEQSAAVEQALARFDAVIRQVHEEVAAAISTIPDDLEALKWWNDYLKATEALHTEVARCRTQQVGHIWETHKLSLTAMGEVIDVSRQRIGQIVDAYERIKAAEEEAPA